MSANLTSTLGFEASPAPRAFGAVVAATALAACVPFAVNFSPLNPGNQIRLPTDSGWVARASKAVAALGPNWDGYGAEPIKSSVLETMTVLVRDLLPSGARAGSIVPGADGSLQAEWHVAKASMGLLLEEDFRLSAWLRVSDADEEVEKFGFSAQQLFREAAKAYLL